MNRYEELITEYEDEVDVYDWAFTGNNKGYICDNNIAVREDLCTIEKACVVAEEIGHHFTTVGDITDKHDLNSIKQERKGRIWAYYKCVGLDGLIECYKEGCRNLYEMADCLNVTIEFLQEAIEYFKGKYGLGITYKDYYIQFYPYFTVKKDDE